MNLAENLDVEMKQSTDKIEFQEFESRHIGPRASEIKQMLEFLGYSDIESFISKVVPRSILQEVELELSAFPKALTEPETVQRLRSIAAQNKVFKSYIGMGYHACFVPTVIQRNILENPGWYTQYTPYQAEISQGRLEAMLNFQSMIMDLTGLAIANASMLDEATAAAEAMNLCLALAEKEQAQTVKRYFVSSACHAQTIAVVRTRAEALGVELVVGEHANFDFTQTTVFGALLQYPETNGAIVDYSTFIKQAHAHKAYVTLACDLLSLCLLVPPGELGADIAVGSAQRFGVPLGFGGPHAAFFATRDEFKRLMPGRLVGISKDSSGRPALRLALQTREQHIRRERATSNICTAQVLLAVMASMYAVYHGPVGLKRIAQGVHAKTKRLAEALTESGYKLSHTEFFDTLQIELDSSKVSAILEKALSKGINLRKVNAKSLGISLNETTNEADLKELVVLFDVKLGKLDEAVSIDNKFKRKSEFLTQEVFNKYHSETEFLRYLKRLEAKDLSLAQSMISLGSCTMKLNATTEMLGLSWEEISNIHPFVPLEQVKGYLQLFKELEDCLKSITGFSAVSLQPNAGSQGEYAGILAIRAYQKNQKAEHRNICLIPRSAHGTNPASAAMAGLEVVVVECDKDGNIDLSDLERQVEAHREKLSLLMVTYPSTHGVFEEGIKQACDLVHAAGGQVYMDGANLNALVGLCRPYDIGADVCHINLHKTFCIPHGGGGPGMGPIATREHLAPFLPGHPVVDLGVKTGPVSAAPWGSASILTISWAYMALMGGAGLKRASQIAILSANYIAKRLNSYFPLVYKGQNGLIAHECILDLRQFKTTSAVEVEDVAKRLMDYGFHAPTISFPVPGTMMVEPTESESKQELDRFCDAMIAISEEIRAIEAGSMDKANNLLKNAPHTALSVTSDEWNRPYSREQAAFPVSWTKEHKFWPAVGRVDGAYGDRHLVCSCGSLNE